jgi:hypothetical protein
MYPHQVLMEKNNLQKSDLSQEAQNYLKDFNHMLRGVAIKETRAEKKGEEYEMTETDINKLNRFSKSVCVQIYEDMNTTYQKAQEEEVNKKKMQEEALELKKRQEEEDAKKVAELEAKKKEEEIAKQKDENKGLFDYFF